MFKETEKFYQKAIILSARYGFDNVSLKEIAFEVGVLEDELLKHIPTKQKLLDGIELYISSFLMHYNPTKEDIIELLNTETPYHVLLRFITSYDFHENMLTKCVYRFLFMEQYRSKRFSHFTYFHIIKPPVENAMRAIDILIELNAIPPCDSRTMAEMWNRTSLIFAMICAHDNSEVTYDDYYKMCEFFVQLIVRGVNTMPKQQIEAKWHPHLQWNQIDEKNMTMKQKIMLTGMDLFSEFGYTNVTMSQIARALNCPISSVYSKYRTKSHIMKDIIDKLITTIQDYVENPAFKADMNKKNPTQIILTLADSYSSLQDNTAVKLYRIIFREQYFNEDLKDFFIGTLFMDIDAISTELETMVENGRIAPCGTREIATAFVYTMCSFAINATLHPKNFDGSEDVKYNIIVLLVGLIVNGYKYPTLME